MRSNIGSISRLGNGTRTKHRMGIQSYRGSRIREEGEVKRSCGVGKEIVTRSGNMGKGKGIARV